MEHWAPGFIRLLSNPAAPYSVGRGCPHFTHDTNEAGKVKALALGVRKIFIIRLKFHPRGSFGTWTSASDHIG